MSKLETLRDGLLNELKDLYSAENQLLKALPKMESKATSQKLKQGLHAHLLETEGQVERLDEIAKLVEEKLTGKVCKAMQGLIEEGNEVIETASKNKALIDALLIGAARRVEHYEIAAYCTTRTMAQELGLDDVVALLSETFDEETAADKKLSSLLSDEVAPQANEAASDESARSAEKHSAEGSQTIKRAGNAARALALLSCLMLGQGASSHVQAQTNAENVAAERAASAYKGDNTGRNVRDQNVARSTADDQKNGVTELEVLAGIRRVIVANGNLSTNAHNVKVVVENGKVVLRGPVKSVAEKTWIEEATQRIATGYTVVNQLEVTPS